MPISIHIASTCLGEREGLAKLDPHREGLSNAQGRKRARARERLPEVDVAKADGCHSPESLESAYQHADEATMLQVDLEAGELRETR